MASSFSHEDWNTVVTVGFCMQEPTNVIVSGLGLNWHEPMATRTFVGAKTEVFSSGPPLEKRRLCRHKPCLRGSNEIKIDFMSWINDIELD